MAAIPACMVNGHDATDELRTETAGAAASAIASIPSVRQALVDMQLGFRKAPGLVADGRDMGTVDLPRCPVQGVPDCKCRLNVRKDAISS